MAYHPQVNESSSGERGTVVRTRSELNDNKNNEAVEKRNTRQFGERKGRVPRKLESHRFSWGMIG